jgi:hypothetical protein
VKCHQRIKDISEIVQLIGDQSKNTAQSNFGDYSIKKSQMSHAPVAQSSNSSISSHSRMSSGNMAVQPDEFMESSQIPGA